MKRREGTKNVKHRQIYLYPKIENPRVSNIFVSESSKIPEVVKENLPVSKRYFLNR
jgi:hypothetical protein